MKPHLTNHLNPSPDLAAVMDREPACQCLVCLHRRESQIRERMIREAQERERAGAA